MVLSRRQSLVHDCLDWRFGDGVLADAVAVCTGHYNKPYAPTIPGQHAWEAADSTRTVSHAQQYDLPMEFSQKAVLIVGARSSGFDIAKELYGVASAVYVLAKGVQEVVYDEGCCWVPVGAEIQEDGAIMWKDQRIRGPGIEAIILATGNCSRARQMIQLNLTSHSNACK